MGSFDGAECCELVGLYILSKLQPMNINVGLYRDDALGVLDCRPRQAELKKKEICRIFKEINLSITIEVNVKVVNFLDITLDLSKGIYKPYMKPGNTPLYINKGSNHPPLITKNIPAAINRRLNNISINEEVFKDAIPPYQEALDKGGYEFKLKFEPPTRNNNKKKTRNKRNITWFNPPFSQNVATNVGARFLKLINTCFPPYHPLAKIINRNTVKVSYRCMPNMGQAVNKHNKKVSNQKLPQSEPPGCNCQGGPDTCPVDEKCQMQGVVYQATVSREDNNTTETYTGLTARRFKDRYYEHRQDFNNQTREGTSLSHHIWNLKEKNTDHSISWKILAKCESFNPATRKCNLCLREKYCIIFKPEGASLNARSELFATCRHRLKLLLDKT